MSSGASASISDSGDTPVPSTEQASTQDVSPAAAEPSPSSTQADSAPTPSATQAETKESLLDAVLRTIPEERDKPDPDKLTLPGEGQSPRPDETKEGQPEPDYSQLPTKEEMARYSSRTRKRIESLVERASVNEADANTARGVRQYLIDNDISKDDFLLTLDLAAAMRRGDFEAFLQGVHPYLQIALEATGRLLPPDLQQAVVEGHMTTATAQQLIRDRYAYQGALAQNQRYQAQVQDQQQTTARTNLSRAVSTSVSDWENQTRSRDPDFDSKQGLMREVLWSVVREMGEPNSPQEAVRIAQETYNRATSMVRGFRPPPRPTTPSPSSVNRPAGARAEPTTMMEAALQGLERARNAS